ncbi:MAG: argininosuccinate lyase [Chloroflexi bacterium]|nr:argininosuccinate lyase [Chloroflexota bacterium]MCI0848970.1 argininosuccinate lyase [Chloroflexota bacterium]MCI0864040.1 argininosuccinate lyase [Chloroflexota bacterium]MCI0898540.1 argininosuccinate lyase [Chloroflexota bacterium]MCI0903020.1 argininosuccinate lyase [Chloroflexota bacterium]
MADFSGYTVSIDYDRRLYKQDIAGSVAHAKMLAKQDIISQKDATQIVQGLGTIEREIREEKFPWDPALEDLHMNIESRLHQLIGAAAGRLHTARSRNDQVALDLRLYTKETIVDLVMGLRSVQRALVELASKYQSVVMPGYTHLQRAQPVLFAHHMLAYFEMFQRDIGRFQDCHRRTDVMPLGSGALAGVPYQTDREFLAAELGFSRISANSMDAVSDRDFVVEFLAAASVCMMHFSRMSEELVLWSSSEFGFIRLSDEFTTGSSIMPQKRNPDFAELARGKTGRVYGGLMAMLTTLKGLPLTYNRDLQEDKEGFFDAADTLKTTLDVFKAMLPGMKLNEERVSSLAGDSQMLATDLADYLVGKGMPFREAHGILRELSQRCDEGNLSLRDLPLEEYKKLSDLFQQDVFDITAQSSAAARDNPGGTAPGRVAAALEEAKKILEAAADGF